MTIVNLHAMAGFSFTQKAGHTYGMPRFLAESEGFEPPEALTSTVFKTAAIDHSANFPFKLPINGLTRLRLRRTIAITPQSGYKTRRVRRTETRSVYRSAMSKHCYSIKQNYRCQLF